MNLQEPEMTRLSSFSTHTRIAFTNCAQKVLEEFGGGQPMELQGNHREGLGKRLAGHKRQNARELYVRP